MAFPKLKNKHTKTALFNPKDYIGYLKKVGKHPKAKPPTRVILFYKTSLLEHILKNHALEPAGGIEKNFFLLKETKNSIGVVGKFGIGAPVTAAVMEELIAFGVKKFLIVGEAGSLQKNLNLGDIIVCDKAIRDEGTSYHYLKHSKYAFASKKLLKKTQEVLSRQGFDFVVGTSWTIDAPYRETITEIKKYKKEGVLTVEMEAAAVFAVAKHRGVEAGAIFTISDSLGELDWKPRFHLTPKNLEKIFEAAIKILIEP